MSDTIATGMEITELAKQELLKARGEGSGFLRIWVEQGGCSGLTYQAVIDDTAGPFDVSVYDDGELRVVTDQQSRFYVEALSIDYSDDLVEAGFRFRNRKASHRCGCGQSFKE